MSSEIKVTNIKHSSSGSNNLVLASDGTTTVSGALTASGGIANAGTISAGTLGSSVVFPGPASGSKGGHILQVNSGVYNFSGDVNVTSSSEVFGPVVSMQMIQANAKVIGLLTLGEIFSNTSSSHCMISLAYKTSSFTAGQGNTSHGATVLTNVQCKWRYNPSGNPATFVLYDSLTNTAGQTLYFAGEAQSDNERFINYGGGATNCTLTVFEVKT